jgi:hypothetical protein
MENLTPDIPKQCLLKSDELLEAKLQCTYIVASTVSQSVLAYKDSQGDRTDDGGSKHP